MKTGSKIQLSKLETELIQNKEWNLTKRAIIEKVYLLFGNMLEVYKIIAGSHSAHFPVDVENANGKISKGENYQGLPYVILEYPSIFSKENIFAIRTMFWWGNFISISLHIAGISIEEQKNITRWLPFLQENNFFICINENQWEYDFETSNYIHSSEIDNEELIRLSSRNFFKISKKMDLVEWDSAPQFLRKCFMEITEFIGINFPGGEKDLLPGFPKAGFDL